MSFWKWFTYDRHTAERRIHKLETENERLKRKVMELEYTHYYNLGREAAMAEFGCVDISDIITEDEVK